MMKMKDYSGHKERRLAELEQQHKAHLNAFDDILDLCAVKDGADLRVVIEHIRNAAVSGITGKPYIKGSIDELKAELHKLAVIKFDKLMAMDSASVDYAVLDQEVLEIRAMLEHINSNMSYDDKISGIVSIAERTTSSSIYNSVCKYIKIGYALKDLPKTAADKKEMFIDEYIIENRYDAANVLATLTEAAQRYGKAVLAHYYDLIGVNSKLDDQNYGWSQHSIMEAHIVPVRGGYSIKFPPVEEF
jgi:hypothetical protein